MKTENNKFKAPFGVYGARGRTTAVARWCGTAPSTIRQATPHACIMKGWNHLASDGVTAASLGCHGNSPAVRVSPLAARPGLGAIHTIFFYYAKSAQIYAYVNPAGFAPRLFSFRFPGPFAHWESFRCAVFVTGVASCACFG